MLILYKDSIIYQHLRVACSKVINKTLSRPHNNVLIKCCVNVVCNNLFTKLSLQLKVCSGGWRSEQAKTGFHEGHHHEYLGWQASS